MKKPLKSKKTVRKNPEWTAAMIAEARRAKEMLPKIFGARTAAAKAKEEEQARVAKVVFQQGEKAKAEERARGRHGWFDQQHFELPYGLSNYGAIFGPCRQSR